MPTPALLSQVAVVILTYNEAPNIRRTLDALRAFPEIVVLDSGSTDDTVVMVSQYANVRVEHRAFDQHAAQWNYALTQCGVTRDWVLALDADYVLPESLSEEIACLPAETQLAGYRATFRYCSHGQRLRGALYPPAIVLYRRAGARYVQDGHTQRLVLDGEIGTLSHSIDHDDRKPLSRWLASQQKYAALEAEHLLAKRASSRRMQDRIRLLALPAPLLVFVYTLLWKRCILDGWPGWFYALQRTFAETLLALELLERRLRPPMPRRE